MSYSRVVISQLYCKKILLKLKQNITVVVFHCEINCIKKCNDDIILQYNWNYNFNIRLDGLCMFHSQINIIRIPNSEQMQRRVNVDFKTLKTLDHELLECYGSIWIMWPIFSIQLLPLISLCNVMIMILIKLIMQCLKNNNTEEDVISLLQHLLGLWNVKNATTFLWCFQKLTLRRVWVKTQSLQRKLSSWLSSRNHLRLLKR